MHRWKIILLAWAMTLFGTAGSFADFRVGDSGSSVRTLQKQLVAAGYSLKVDGAYGKQTASAVRKFQKKKHLAVDGVVGPVTYEALTGKKMPRTTKPKAAALATDKKSGAKIAQMEEEPVSKEQKKVSKKKKGGNKKEIQAVSPKAKEVTEEAKKYIGVPYRFGGTDTHGFDCSGFIQYVFRQKGMSLPRSADAQYGLGKKISRKALRPGDLVFFSTYAKGVSHSGIYMGNGSFISATSSRGIAVADMTKGYWSERYVGAKRIL